MNTWMMVGGPVLALTLGWVGCGPSNPGDCLVRAATGCAIVTDCENSSAFRSCVASGLANQDDETLGRGENWAVGCEVSTNACVVVGTRSIPGEGSDTEGGAVTVISPGLAVYGPGTCSTDFDNCGASAQLRTACDRLDCPAKRVYRLQSQGYEGEPATGTIYDACLSLYPTPTEPSGAGAPLLKDWPRDRYNPPLADLGDPCTATGYVVVKTP